MVATKRVEPRLVGKLVSQIQIIKKLSELEPPLPFPRIGGSLETIIKRRLIFIEERDGERERDNE